MTLHPDTWMTAEDLGVWATVTVPRSADGLLIESLQADRRDYLLMRAAARQRRPAPCGCGCWLHRVWVSLSDGRQVTEAGGDISRFPRRERPLA
jgi:hypothetical protein